jgi:hypothetical protein
MQPSRLSSRGSFTVNTSEDEDDTMFPHTPTQSQVLVTAEDKRSVPFLRLCSFISRLAQVAGASSSIINILMLFTIEMPVRCWPAFVA